MAFLQKLARREVGLKAGAIAAGLGVSPGLKDCRKNRGSPWRRGCSEAGVPNQAPHRRWVVGKRVKLHLCSQPLPITRITTWALSPVRSALAWDSHRVWNLLCLTHPETIPTPSTEKLFSTKSVPGAKNVGDCCCKGLACKHAKSLLSCLSETARTAASQAPLSMGFFL